METVKGYERLDDVLARAYQQASAGKGKERHAVDAPFHEQPMQKLCELYGVGFALGQAAKKAQESMRLPHERAVAELLGAINYLAGAVICLERQEAERVRGCHTHTIDVGPVNDNLPLSKCCGQPGSRNKCLSCAYAASKATVGVQGNG